MKKTPFAMSLLLAAAIALPVAQADDDDYDEPAISRAAEHASAAEVQRLIQNGANVNATNNDGETPLMEAAGNGRLEIVNILIKAGANVIIPDFTESDEIIDLITRSEGNAV